MGLIQKLKGNSANKPHSDGPEEWARIAREKDAEIKRQRAAEELGDKAVRPPSEGEPPAEQQGERKHFSDVEVLSLDYLKHLDEMGIERGKYVRIGDVIFISPGPRPSHAGHGLQHKDILERALKRPEVQEKNLGAEAIKGAAEATIGPDGLTDAGKFDIYLDREDEPRDDGFIGRFRVFGASASYGAADKESRERTVQIAADALGEHMRVEYARHMDFS